MSDSEAVWKAIENAPQQKIEALFAADPDRLKLLTLDLAGLYFDWSKTHLDAGLIDQFVALSDAMDLKGKRHALFNGESVNPSEGRAAEHPAERGEGTPESVHRAISSPTSTSLSSAQSCTSTILCASMLPPRYSPAVIT